uniref:Uncharacterized protein n=1 Tax=Avena sativa TaxID=4498 RepID=A0ACD5Z9D4_AVESA
MSTNVFVTFYLKFQMGKRSGTRNKKKTSEVKCSCLLFAEEANFTLLIPYLSKLSPDIISNELPAGELQAGQANVPGMLIPAAQEILFRVIHMITRELEANAYFETISETNIVITESDLPKMMKNTLKEASHDKEVARNKKRDNVHQLRDMIDRVLIATSLLYQGNRRINPELRHLLGLMRDYEAGKCLFLIKYPFCLIPVSNRGQAYIQLYDRTMDVLRTNDPVAYVLVVMGVEVPDDWATKCLGNEQLADSLRRGDYDLHATRNPGTTEPRLIPLKYLRNRPSHSQEGAAAPLTARGVKFTPADLARSLYIRFPMAFVSIQKALHFVGELQKIEGFIDLFPGRLRIPRNH